MHGFTCKFGLVLVMIPIGRSIVPIVLNWLGLALFEFHITVATKYIV